MREVYNEAEPGLDWDELVENPDDVEDNWWEDQYLDDEREREILNKHFDKHDLTDDEESALTWTCILEYGPSNTPPEER